MCRLNMHSAKETSLCVAAELKHQKHTHKLLVWRMMANSYVQILSFAVP